MSPHGWNHPMCRECWRERHPRRRPQALAEQWRQNERCCWCYTPTTSGIYVRSTAPEFCRDVRREES